MNIYKEIFLDCENDNKSDKVIELISSSNSIQNKNYSNSLYNNKEKKGFTCSFDYFIVNCITDTYSFTVEFLETVRNNFIEKNANFQNKFTFKLTNEILNNEIFLYQTSKNSLILTLILSNHEIKSVEFKINKEKSNPSNENSLINFIITEGMIYLSDHESKIAKVDHMSYDAMNNSDFFCCATNQGTLQILQISKGDRGVLSSKLIKEHVSNQSGNFLTDETNFFSRTFKFNIKEKFTKFFSSKYNLPEIKALKYLNNNLVSYLTEDKKFKIFNTKNNQEIFSEEIIKDELIEEKLLNGKICFMDFDDDTDKENQKKIFNFSIYLEFQAQKILTFFKIPFKKENKNSENYLSRGDFGYENSISEFEHFKINGNLIDLIYKDQKFWCIYSRANLDEEKTFQKYEAKVFYLNNSQREKDEKLLSGNSHVNNFVETDIILLENKLEFLALKIKQISQIQNEKIRRKLLFALIYNNESIISNENLISFNEKIELNFAEKNNNSLLDANKKIGQLRFAENQKKTTNRKNILKRILNENFLLEDLLNFITNIFLEANNSEVISFGDVKNLSFDSICILRNTGIGFVTYLEDFNNLNEIIELNEINILKIIYGERIFPLFDNIETDVEQIQNEIINYCHSQIKLEENNLIFVVFALMRINFLENFTKINDLDFALNFFNCESEEKNLKDLVNEEFCDFYKSENKLIYLDCIDKIIFTFFRSNENLVFIYMNKVLDMFKVYKSEENSKKIYELIKEENKKEDLNYKYNYKFCEIIKKFMQNKICGIFNISRDLLAFCKWTQFYMEGYINFDKISILKQKNKNKMDLDFEGNFNNIENDNFKEGINEKFLIDDDQSILSHQDDNNNQNLSNNNPQNFKKNLKFQKFLAKATHIFSQTYTINLLSKLSDSILLSDKSAFEKSCIHISNKENENFNYIDLKIFEIFKTFGEKIYNFFNENLIDFLISNIWSGLLIEKKKPKDFLIHKNLIVKTFLKLISYKQTNLINVLTKLFYNEENFNEILNFLKIGKPEICEYGKVVESKIFKILGFLATKEKKLFKKEVNNLIEVLESLEINSLKNVENEKKKFSEFFEMLRNQENFEMNLINGINFLKKNEEFFNEEIDPFNNYSNNFELFVFYSIEDLLKKFYPNNNSELKFYFYYNSFQFVFQRIKLNKTFNDPKSQNFILNFIKTSFDIDFDLVLSFYVNNIEDIYHLKDFNSKIIDYFVEDFLKIFKNLNSNNTQNSIKEKEKTFIHSDLINEEIIEKLKFNKANSNTFKNYLNKIIKSDRRLLTEICKKLENECDRIKSKNMLFNYFKIKQNFLEDNEFDIEISINLFILLDKIYGNMNDEFNKVRINNLYHSALEDLIKFNKLDVKELLKLYSEKGKILAKILMGVKNMQKKGSSVYIITSKKINTNANGKIFIKFS